MSFRLSILFALFLGISACQSLPFEDDALLSPAEWQSLEPFKGGLFNPATGTFAIPPIYVYVSEFYDTGLASFQPHGKSRMIGEKKGFLDTRGKIIVPAQFNAIEDHAPRSSIPLIPFRIRGDFGYLDTRGNIVIPAQFDEARAFSENGLAMVKKDDKIGFINTQGKMIIPAQFDNARSYFVHDRIAVKQGRKWGYINAQGKMVIPPQFDEAYTFAPNGLARVQLGEKYGFIDIDGKMAIPAQFSLAKSFLKEGLAAFKEEGKTGYKCSEYGYINAEGKIVIPAQFFLAARFVEQELLLVNGKLGDQGRCFLGAKYGFVNLKGEIKIPLQFDEAKEFSKNGLAPIKEQGKWGYINTEGKRVIPAQFKYALRFSKNNVARVVLASDEEALIDHEGRVLVVALKGCDRFINAKGETIWAREKPEGRCGNSSLEYPVDPL